MEINDDFDVREVNGVGIDFEAIRKAVLEIIRAVGEDPGREGLINTPDRVSRMYAELLSGYGADPEKIINDALFNVDYDEMVLVRDIEFYSLCEHHMLPFLGRAHVASVHMCSMMRGVKKHDARMTTSAMHGAFRANLATRQEFLDNISRGARPLQI
jgi:GTP cyclohydrolase I